MTVRRRPPLALATAVLITACGGDGGTTTPPEVADVLVTPATATLDALDATQQFTAQAVTEDGDPVPDVTITWESSAPTVATVSSTGLATAVGDGTAFITAEADGVTGNAELMVAIVGLQVSSPVLTNGRLTLPYQGSVEARGGAGGYTFDVVQGSLPDGLSLEDDGTIVGTPTRVETASFRVRVTDAANETASRQVSITVCGAPEPFAVGESRAVDPPAPGQCGVFLPSGQNHRYRVGLIRSNTDEDEQDVETLTLSLEANPGPAALQAAPSPVARASARPRGPAFRLPSRTLERYREVAAATRARHEELRHQEMEMIRRIGTEGVLPDLRGAALPLRAAAQAPLPAKLRLDPSTPGCTAARGTEVTALKIAENDFLGIYQDSTQNAGSGTRVTDAEAQTLLNFYADHGKPVIDEYFGGVSDINGDGKVVVFITPAVDGNTAAFVWSGDFFSREECPASNAMEIVFFNQSIVAALDNPDSPAQGLETLVHEMKHVSSLYQRVLRSQSLNRVAFHPSWWEEGVAEIAGGVAARLGWAADGGPAVTDMLDEQDWRDAIASGESLTDDAQYGVLLRLLRTQEYLASQPNGLVVTPLGARDDHSVYGSGWVFGRWLGDGFGDAASAPLAEGELWAQMNDQGWPSGIQGIQDATGSSWGELLDGYVLALMVNGTAAPPPERAFTTYDFVSSIELWCFAADNPPCEENDPNPPPAGAFPWPVTTSDTGEPSRSFASAVYEGPAGPGGVRIFDFVSDGSGAGTELHVEAPTLTRMVVVRIG